MVTVYSFVVDGAVDNIFVLVDTSVIGTLEVTMVTSEVGSKLVVGKAVVDAVYSFVVDDAVQEKPSPVNPGLQEHK